MADREKEPIQILRERHGGASDKLKAHVKNQNSIRKAIKGALSSDAMTIPQITEATGLKSEEIVWQVVAMKRYGDVLEAGCSGDYYTYALKGEA